MGREREERAGLSKLRQTYERHIDMWIRHDETGWRFYDNQGRRFVLSSEEGAALHREARKRLDGLFDELEGHSWLMLVPAVLVGMLGLRLFSEFALVRAMPSAVYFVPCLLFLFKDVTAEIRFIFAMQRWREEQAQSLRVRHGREHESGTYSWLFDPRLGRWAVGGLVLLGVLALAILSNAPIALAIVAVGLAIIGVATFGMAKKDSGES